MSEKNNAAVCTAEKPADACGLTVDRDTPGADCALRDDSGRLVALCPDSELVPVLAAAPELYAALEAILPAFDTMLCWMWKDMPEADRTTRYAALKQAEAALALVRTA